MYVLSFMTFYESDGTTVKPRCTVDGYVGELDSEDMIEKAP